MDTVTRAGSLELDWSHAGCGNYDAYTYYHQLYIKPYLGGFVWKVYDLAGKQAACGQAETVELAQAAADVWVTLKEATL